MAHRTTPLYDEHVAYGASMTSFGGWLMPLRYMSEVTEHHAVRETAGLFDMSHMGDIRVEGPDAAVFLDHMLVGYISKVRSMGARYSMLCSEDGGVLDDVILYHEAPGVYSIITNAAHAQLVITTLRQCMAGFDVAISDIQPGRALIALQGPRAADIMRATGGLEEDRSLSNGTGFDELKYYTCMDMRFEGETLLVSRTGYTGEDGFEMRVSARQAVALWRALLAAGEPQGLLPAGLSARDTLRLEAGMPLYGHELDPTTTPFEAGMGHVVRFDKVLSDGTPVPFIGRKALAARRLSPTDRMLVGLRGEGRRSARAHYDVVSCGSGSEPVAVVGRVTSGAPSPTLGYPIAMAYVIPEVAAEGTQLAVDVRGRLEPFVVVPMPFYRRPQY